MKLSTYLVSFACCNDGLKRMVHMQSGMDTKAADRYLASGAESAEAFISVLNALKLCTSLFSLHRDGTFSWSHKGVFGQRTARWMTPFEALFAIRYLTLFTHRNCWHLLVTIAQLTFCSWRLTLKRILFHQSLKRLILRKSADPTFIQIDKMIAQWTEESLRSR